MDFLSKIIPIAAGGAVGAVARYLVNISPLAGVFDRFPLPTFVINVTGSFLAGFLLILFTDKLIVSESLRLAVMVGFLGAFTTFSAFEAELFGLIDGRHITLALFYAVLSVVLGFIAVVAGVGIGRRV